MFNFLVRNEFGEFEGCSCDYCKAKYIEKPNITLIVFELYNSDSTCTRIVYSTKDRNRMLTKQFANDIIKHTLAKASTTCAIINEFSLLSKDSKTSNRDIEQLNVLINPRIYVKKTPEWISKIIDEEMGETYDKYSS
jgi:hypothetical protein